MIGRFCAIPNIVGGEAAPLISHSGDHHFFHFAIEVNSCRASHFLFIFRSIFSLFFEHYSKWVAQAEKVRSVSQSESTQKYPANHIIGGKVKPLKAAKKEKKELDEDDLAYKEKQRAGEFSLQ